MMWGKAGNPDNTKEGFKRWREKLSPDKKEKLMKFGFNISSFEFARTGNFMDFFRYNKNI